VAVSTRNAAGEEATNTFDFLVLCNGHTSVPYTPEIPGAETFSGRKYHCKNFRDVTPGEYSDKTVCIVAAWLSSFDLFETLYNLGELPQKLVISGRKRNLFNPIKDPEYASMVESGRIVIKPTIDSIDG
jgi:cation diffusion facilitator CzcD-associated flavoprotein CzcO